MNQLKGKMLLAPIFAVALALLLAGAINSLVPPMGDEANLQGFGTSKEAPPTPMPTHPPQAAPASISDSPISSFLFVAGAVIVGVLVIILFFREKGLAEALNESS
ncbi:MAG: hypothetical protein ACM3JE_02615 [Betaproteobacteria bacterium]